MSAVPVADLGGAGLVGDGDAAGRAALAGDPPVAAAGGLPFGHMLVFSPTEEKA